MLRVWTLGVMLVMAVHAASAPGPLRVCAENPRYFADTTGTPVYLTGSHTWAALQERAGPDTPPFDYAGYLDFMQEHHHNLLRLWTWEHAAWMQFTDVTIRYEPNRYPRTGPGEALDGRPKFDVTRFGEAYFDRLRERVKAAGERGIYVMVMLFQGFSVEQKGTEGVDPTKGNPWDGHPFSRANNINSIDGDPNGDGEGEETHALAVPETTRLQEAYVREVIDRLNDLDCVLWEISNESRATSTEWQYHLIDFIHEYERTKPKQHPVVMTVQLPGGSNDVLFESPAEAISPNPGSGYRDDPPDAHGRKVILNDTDHLWGIGGEHPWVWKCFCRGQNPIFMDPYRDVRMGHTYNPRFDPIRRNMGYARRYAERLDLRKAVPHDDLPSTGYCLANPGSAYVVYLPEGGSVTVDLAAADGTLQVEWLDPMTGETASGQPVQGGAVREFNAPFVGDAVLYVSSG
jgi:Family of unknown function (DUF6298)/Putative collagen-binding domain of a collagenase/Protein of unknown function (DUF4038)